MKKIALLGVFLTTSLNLHGWDDHFRITRLACESLLDPKIKVTYLPLDEALSFKIPTLKARTTKDFLLEFKLNKKWKFPLKLSEHRNKTVLATSVLSVYSDEPDWGPDMELFGPDQYPELWTTDTPYIAGREGIKSDGFRHMYFPGKLDWREPISSFQIPMRPLGEAPTRAEIFFNLSRQFFQAKLPYWGFRFLAWSFHYIEDLFQPFHVRQAPTKALVRFKFSGILPAIDIEASADQIEYYHLGYERLVNEVFRPGDNPFKKALAGQSMSSPIHKPLREVVLANVVEFSSSYASAVGRESYRLFPPFHPTKEKTVQDFIGSLEWRVRLRNEPAKTSLISNTGKIFQRMAEMLRRVLSDSGAIEKNGQQH